MFQETGVILISGKKRNSSLMELKCRPASSFRAGPDHRGGGACQLYTCHMSSLTSHFASKSRFNLLKMFFSELKSTSVNLESLLTWAECWIISRFPEVNISGCCCKHSVLAGRRQFSRVFLSVWLPSLAESLIAFRVFISNLPAHLCHISDTLLKSMLE